MSRKSGTEPDGDDGSPKKKKKINSKTYENKMARNQVSTSGVFRILSRAYTLAKLSFVPAKLRT